MTEIYSTEEIQKVLYALENFTEFTYNDLTSSEKKDFTESIINLYGEAEFLSYNNIDEDYKPYREIRKDLPGEVAMMKHWNKLMNTLPQYYDRMIDFILNTEDTTIRDARICSSIILWLGTNIGVALLHEADRLKEKVKNSYSVQFHLESMRYPHDPLDYVRRIITFPGIPDPEITVKDLVTIYKLMNWLGSDSGQEFLKDVDEEVKIRVDAERQAFKKLNRII